MSRTGITGIILAGGDSIRMGSPKPFVVWNGKPLVQWVFESLQPVCREILIIANSGDYSFLSAAVYPDNYPGNGPAAGIESGLGHLVTDRGLVVTCDTPNLSTSLFHYLVSRHNGFDISITAHEGIDEPLIGIYNRGVQGVFRDAILAGNPHPPRIIRQCRWQQVHVGPDLDFYRENLFLNLNSPNDLI